MKRIFLISILFFSFLWAPTRILLIWKGIVYPDHHMPWQFRVIGPTTIKGAVKAWNLKYKTNSFSNHVTFAIYEIKPVYEYKNNKKQLTYDFRLRKMLYLKPNRPSRFEITFDSDCIIEMIAENASYFEVVFEICIIEYSEYDYWNWDYY